MSTQWLISKDDETPVLLETIGITACVVSLAANGEDSMSFTVDADYTSDPAFPDKTKLALIRAEGESTRCVFVGWVRGIPRDGAEDSLSYFVEGPAARLRRITYAQEWTVIADDDGDPALALEPHVVLGEDNSGAKITTGAQIENVIAFAASQGLPIAVGAINAGIGAPKEEHENIWCMDAICACLRWTPTHVLWWNYDNAVGGSYVPAANVSSAAEMDAVPVVLHNADVTDDLFTPRYDLVVPGVVITYRIAGEKDGKPYERRAYDTAGDTGDPERISVYIDLQGATYETLTQDVVTADYPTDYAGAQAWLASMVPWLAALPAGDWATISSVRSQFYPLPRYLVEGTISDWMGVEAVKETITVKVRIKTRDADGNVTEDTTRDIPITLISTNAVTKTYSKNILTGFAEPVPVGLAAALYAEWSALPWEGRFAIDEQEPSFSIIPGKAINCTGARSEWATMRAVVQSVSVDVASGATSFSVGPCARLEADSRMALFRAVRSRRNPSRPSRTDGDIEAISGADAVSGQDTESTQAQHRHRLSVRAPDSLGNAHEIDLDPAGVSFGQSAAATPQSIRPREVSLLQPDGTVRKAQILSGEPYGDPTAPGEPEPPQPPPCGHPGNAGGGGGDEDHPANEDGAGGDVDHPGSEEGEGGITPESGGTCE